MEINELVAGAAATTASRETSDALGQQDFLRMLIAQLENQDPLDPQDASEFSSQLAQFSSLEQLTAMRTSIDSLAAAGGVSDGLATAFLIGERVLVESTRLSVGGEGAPLPELSLELGSPSEILSVELVDASGRTSATAAGPGALSAGRHEPDWAAFGPTPSSGVYSVRVNVAPGAATPTVLVRSTVSGAALDADGTTLLLGDVEVPLASLREIGQSRHQQG